MWDRPAILAGVTVVTLLGAAGDVMAQALKDVQTPVTPLVLKAQGGIRGNSHMIMQDKNNLQIAGLILQWIDARVSKCSGEKK
jgi:hypothetical protein